MTERHRANLEIQQNGELEGKKVYLGQPTTIDAMYENDHCQADVVKNEAPEESSQVSYETKIVKRGVSLENSRGTFEKQPQINSDGGYEEDPNPVWKRGPSLETGHKASEGKGFKRLNLKESRGVESTPDLNMKKKDAYKQGT